MKKLLVVAVVLMFSINLIYAQGELNEQQKVFFRNEKSFGILLNTDGFGLSYRDGKRLDFLNKRLLEIEFGTLKDPKEVKQTNPYYQTTGSFVFGKLNTVVYLRGGYGHQHEIFKKADLGGVAIRYFYSAGPVFALYKPIYYSIIYVAGTLRTRDEKFNITIHQSDIFSKAPFTKGLNETKILPGLFAKGGFNFEYSKEDKVIHAIELGCQANAFPKKIPIMASSSNKAIFLSLFVSYRFGIIIDPMDPESKKFPSIFSRKRQ
jgi:hypothetical protein